MDMFFQCAGQLRFFHKAGVNMLMTFHFFLFTCQRLPDLITFLIMDMILLFIITDQDLLFGIAVIRVLMTFDLLLTADTYPGNGIAAVRVFMFFHPAIRLVFHRYGGKNQRIGRYKYDNHGCRKEQPPEFKYTV